MDQEKELLSKFALGGKVAVVTGGGGVALEVR